MKTLILLFTLSMLALGSCETVEIEKLVFDTVYIDRPIQSFVPRTITDTVFINRESIRTDTVEVKVVVTQTDTLIQVVTDSVYIDKLVLVHDTIKITDIDTVFLTQTIIDVDTIFQTETITDTVFITHHHYLDTMYVIGTIRPVYSVPDELQPFVEDFYMQAAKYGHNAPGGVLLVYYTDNLPGEGWSSHSYDLGGQMVVEISGSIPPHQLYTPMLRELARLQLGKKYTNIPDRIMNPVFPPERLVITSPDKESYLQVLFSNPI
jgi:hypothetical protein